VSSCWTSCLGKLWLFFILLTAICDICTEILLVFCYVLCSSDVCLQCQYLQCASVEHRWLDLTCSRISVCHPQGVSYVLCVSVSCVHLLIAFGFHCFCMLCSTRPCMGFKDFVFDKLLAKWQKTATVMKSRLLTSFAISVWDGAHQQVKWRMRYWKHTVKH